MIKWELKGDDNMIRMILYYRKLGLKKCVKTIKNILYVKWKLKQCIHLCDTCIWWYDCYANYEEYEKEQSQK